MKTVSVQNRGHEHGQVSEVESEFFCDLDAALYRYLFTSSEKALVLFSLNGRVIDVSVQFEELTGYCRTAILGLSILSLARLLTHKGPLLWFRNPLRTVNNHEVRSREIIAYSKSGKRLTLEISVRSIAPETGTGRRANVIEIANRDVASNNSDNEMEEVHKSLVEHVGIGVFRTTPGATGRFLEVNQEMENITGYSREELLNMNVADLYVHPEQRGETIRQILSGELTSPKEVLFKKKDGTVITVRDKKVAVPSANGRTMYLEGFLEDITEQKKTEYSLKESEEKFKNLAEQSPNMIFINQNGRVMYANKKCIEVMGYSQKEFLSPDFNFLDLVAPVSKELVSQNFRRHMDHQEVIPYEYSLTAKDGRIIDCILASKLIPYNGSTAIMGTITDISERKKDEKALYEERENFRNSVVESPLGIMITDLEGKPVYANPAMLKLWGYFSLEEMKAVPFRNRYTSESLKTISDHVELAKRGGTVPRGELTAICKDGQKKIIMADRKAIIWNGEECLQIIYQDITERINSENALRAERENYRNSVDASPFGIQIISFHGKVVYANQTMLEMWHYGTIEQLRSIPVSQAFTPDSIARLHEMNDLRKLGTALPPHELTMICGDGQLRQVRAYSKETVWNGETCLQLLYEDITQRKKDEETLMIKNALLEAQTETTIDGIIAVDRDNKVILCNKQFRNMWNLPDSSVGVVEISPLVNLCTPLLRKPETIIEKATYLYEHQEEKSRDLVELTDGRLYDSYSSQLVDVRGVYRGRIWYMRDVTEETTLKRKLENAAQEWQTTFDSIADFISIHDRNNRLVRVNKAFADLFHVPPGELIGKLCSEIVHGTKLCPEDCPGKQALKTGIPVFYEMFEPAQQIWLRESAFPMVNEIGEVSGTVHIVRDITAKKLADQQLTMTDRLASIGELVSGITHELNNPLTSVIGFSQLLLEKDIITDAREDLTIINNEAQRAARIVKNLLTFARKHAPLKQLSQINNILQDILNVRAYEQKVSNIEVIRHLDDQLPEVTVDYFQLQQVFINIIINAEFFMVQAHDRGILTVTSERIPGFIRVTIADDGPGIAPENIKKIFDPFYSTKEVGKGTGLGLSICHGIVSEHGGRIYAESVPGKGAVFIIDLPIDGR